MTSYAIESRSPLFPRPVHLAFGLIVLVSGVALLAWTEQRALQERAAARAAATASAPAPQIVFDQPATRAPENPNTTQESVTTTPVPVANAGATVQVADSASQPARAVEPLSLPDQGLSAPGTP